MSRVEIIFYSDEKGCPVLEWLSRLPKKVEAKARMRIGRLAGLGHELKRPETDYLERGIYELRWRFQTVNYRILHFFHGREVVVLAHALTKEDIVPARDIDTALKRKKVFDVDPEGYTFKGVNDA